MIVNRNTIREQNETIVLTAIINHPNTSRAAISHDSGLNKATVSEIVKKLLKEKLVVPTRYRSKFHRWWEKTGVVEGECKWWIRDDTGIPP